MIKENELKQLAEATPKEEVKFRVGRKFDYESKRYAMMLKYIDARYVQDTLDRIVGTGNWTNEYFEIKGNLFCKITIYFEREDGEIRSISKMDCGTESNVEKENVRFASELSSYTSEVQKEGARITGGLGKYQSEVQSLFTDTAAENARLQFNAKSQTQVDQFYDQLGATLEKTKFR